MGFANGDSIVFLVVKNSYKINIFQGITRLVGGLSRQLRAIFQISHFFVSNKNIQTRDLFFYFDKIFLADEAKSHPLWNLAFKINRSGENGASVEAQESLSLIFFDKNIVRIVEFKFVSSGP